MGYQSMVQVIQRDGKNRQWYLICPAPLAQALEIEKGELLDGPPGNPTGCDNSPAADRSAIGRQDQTRTTARSRAPNSLLRCSCKSTSWSATADPAPGVRLRLPPRRYLYRKRSNPISPPTARSRAPGDLLRSAVRRPPPARPSAGGSPLAVGARPELPVQPGQASRALLRAPGAPRCFVDDSPLHLSCGLLPVCREVRFKIRVCLSSTTHSITSPFSISKACASGAGQIRYHWRFLPSR